MPAPPAKRRRAALRASLPGAWSPQSGPICRIRTHRGRTADVVPGALDQLIDKGASSQRPELGEFIQ